MAAYTIEETARLLGVTRSRVSILLRDGILRQRRGRPARDGMKRVSADSIREYLLARDPTKGPPRKVETQR